LRVYWTAPAEAQLRAIELSLADSSRQYAGRTIDRIVARTQQLSTFPRSGAVVDKAAPLEIRVLIEEPYRIFYVVGPNHVDILGVVHASRDIF
jgi:plasmid stabilization system protein ParE